MTTILDTSSLIRFFTKDILEKAVKVKKLLETEEHILIPDVVFPELEYVLSNEYEVSRKNLLHMFQFLASQKNIQVSGSIKKAIELFGETNLDMADCLIAATSLKGKLASFDKKLLQVNGVTPFFS